jgi:hypothetical protein
MSCCGNKRTSLAVAKISQTTATSRPSTASRPVVEARPSPVTPVATMPMPWSSSPGQIVGTVRLRYLARAAILVRGARSGAAYRFSENQQVVAVQRIDVELLLATGHFRREA